MEYQHKQEILIEINQHFIELLERMRIQQDQPANVFISELEQLQLQLSHIIDKLFNHGGAYEARLAKRFLELQELERRDISDYLYNQFGQTLFSFMLGLNLLQNYELDTEIKDHLQEMREQTYRASVQIKELANRLHPLPISDLGLVPAIRSYVHSLQDQNSIAIECKINEINVEISPLTSVFIYRILESIMLYILKNDFVEHIKLLITFTNKKLVFRVLVAYSKDGHRVGSEKDLDYYEILQRVDLIGGTFFIEDLYALTQIEIMLPIIEQDE